MHIVIVAPKSFPERLLVQTTFSHQDGFYIESAFASPSKIRISRIESGEAGHSGPGKSRIREVTILDSAEKSLFSFLQRQSVSSSCFLFSRLSTQLMQTEWFRQGILKLYKQTTSVITLISLKQEAEIEALCNGSYVHVLRYGRQDKHSFMQKLALFISTLPKSQLRMLDQRAKKNLGIPENILIENASRGMFEVLEQERICYTRVCICAGRGNNGADSLALGRHLLNRAVPVSVILVQQEKPLNNECAFQLTILQKMYPGLSVWVVDTERDVTRMSPFLKNSDLVIDGIFGIGFQPPLDTFHQMVFRYINSYAKRVVACDIPSGLSADEGTIDTIAVKADWTVSFISAKPGFFLQNGPSYVGKIFVKDIGVSDKILQSLA